MEDSTQAAFTKAVMELVAVSKMRAVLRRSWVKVNGQHCWDVLLCQQMLAAMKHVASDNKAILDHTSPALCTPITPFPADPICSGRGSDRVIPSAARRCW